MLESGNFLPPLSLRQYYWLDKKTKFHDQFSGSHPPRRFFGHGLPGFLFHRDGHAFCVGPIDSKVLCVCHRQGALYRCSSP